MSVVQTTYPNRHGFLVAGQIVNTSTYDADSHTAAGNLPFGYGVELLANGSVQPGAGRQPVALLAAALNTSATSVNIDTENNPYTELPAGQHYIIDSEIVYVSATSATAITVMVRGSLGSTAAAHSNNDVVLPLIGNTTFHGVAVMDERVQASSGEQYTAGEIAAIMYRGDIAVRVSDDVVVGGLVVVTRQGTTGDELGRLSSRAPDANHVLIPGARFIRAADDNDLAVVRLAGPTAFSAQI